MHHIITTTTESQKKAKPQKGKTQTPKQKPRNPPNQRDKGQHITHNKQSHTEQNHWTIATTKTHQHKYNKNTHITKNKQTTIYNNKRKHHKHLTYNKHIHT